MKGLEHFPYKERLRDGTVDPGKEMAQTDLITVYKHLKAGAKRTEPGSTSWCPMPRQGAIGTNWNTRHSH